MLNKYNKQLTEDKIINSNLAIIIYTKILDMKTLFTFIIIIFMHNIASA